MKTFLLSPLSAAVLALAASVSAQNAIDIKPSPQQTAWQDLEIGVIIHFGTNTFLDREWGDGTAGPKVFNPSNVDTDQWMKAVKAAGAKYAVLVAKHHDGFTLWPSEQTDYGVKSSPWMNGKGDLVRMAADSARANGLKFGVYLSPWDRHEPKYKDPKAYDEYYLKQLDELSTHYGDLIEFWLDGAGSAGRKYDFDSIIDELRTYQPNTMVFADVALFKYADLRWVGTESGSISYEDWNVIDRAGYLRWRPIEADTPLHKLHWFWHPNDEATLKSVSELVEVYNNTVGHGGQLMLGIAPDNTGRLPEADVMRLKEFGDAIKRLYSHNLIVDEHAKPASADESAAIDNDPETFWSSPPGSHHATVEVTFAKPVTFDRALSMEWLNDGQHIQKYAIEIYKDGAWQRIVEAQAIGHKKIDIFRPVTAQRVRLNLLSTTSEAHIREFQLFSDNPDGRRP
ncbi:alpha-L-fucosidase [Acidobacterium sp. S8]|uniref:alpha-L-fucosidase n=1 Tax=Acidobacterium sp. S8 TaxID=1641854 RepID=UPI00131DCC7C|nr:alpha-L-fucosidase [Acidobacterium sp. S8]